MKLSVSKTAIKSGKKTGKVIKNAHTAAEQQAIGDRWAEHKGPRMTLAETLAHAATPEYRVEQPTD